MNKYFMAKPTMVELKMIKLTMSNINMMKLTMKKKRGPN
jgi:hypothetical protein